LQTRFTSMILSILQPLANSFHLHDSQYTSAPCKLVSPPWFSVYRVLAGCDRHGHWQWFAVTNIQVIFSTYLAL